jgi:hypothetical protein
VKSSFWALVSGLARAVLQAAGFAAATAVVYLTFATAQTAYPAQSYRIAASYTYGTGSVGACVRTPVVSRAGFGRWWECDVTVSLSDGRQVFGVARPGVVSPADRGRPVAFEEVCSGQPGKGTCRYSRHGSIWAETLIRLVGMVELVILLIGGSFTLFFLVMGVLFIMAFFRGKAVAGISALRPGNATVHIACVPPAYPFAELYAGTVPILTIDEEQPIEVADWDTITTFTLPAGRHSLKATNRFGSSTLTVAPATIRLTVEGGDEHRLVYQAPNLPARSGRLRDAGQVPEFEWPPSRS